MPNYLKQYIRNQRQTPQTEPIPGKLMVANSAGGYAFAVDKWRRLTRFLVLGSEGGTYYITQKALTIEKTDAVEDYLARIKTLAVKSG